MSERRYASPQALRRAVTDRLRELAGQRSGARLGDLMHQFAYDRLLARVFTADADRWVLKGAAAMLARLPAAARHSNDIDLYSQTGDLAEAERALRRAAAVDLCDYFRFVLGPARSLKQEAKAMRVPITAYLGPTEFASFHADLVASLSMTGEAEEVRALIDIDIGLPQPRYRAYPVADHIADKVCAMIETHPRKSGEPAASTRYRDLVDLATFARSSEIDGKALAAALRSESERRGLTLPDQLADPSGADWRAGYARSVRDAPALPDRDLETALRTVRAMLDPILAGERVARWDPTTLSWLSP
ncbi:MAG: nucleotidyl transferase AbiEii/AbiGii toxin family protein [Solirubrobacterales bacterium]